MDIIVRNVSDQLAGALSALAERSGMSREAFIREHLERVATAGLYVPRWGESLAGVSGSGGHIKIENLETALGGGAKHLSEAEFAAYKHARRLADPRNGSRWDEARKALEAAGFEVYWE